MADDGPQKARLQGSEAPQIEQATLRLSVVVSVAG